MKGEELVRYIQFLPVLNVVKENPLRIIYTVKPKYKTKPKPKRKYKKRVEGSDKTKKFAVTRFCDFCHEEFVATRKTQFFCKKECSNKWYWEQNKNPLSLHVGVIDFPSNPGYSEDYRVPPEILAQAELYTDCASDFEIGITGAFYEDMDDLSMLLRSEYALAESRYEKRANAKDSGKKYWQAKMAKSYRRKKVGADPLPTIRRTNFELRALRYQKEKRGEIPKHPILTEAEVENPGFATITPLKTRSGKDVAELLDIVARKKLEKRAIGGN